jgi:hypothetical protein
VQAVNDVSDWFEAGWAVYSLGGADPHRFPPLGERQAQRWWLGGFATAWAEGCEERPVVLALAGILQGRAQLLHELLSHASAPGAHTLH